MKKCILIKIIDYRFILGEGNERWCISSKYWMKFRVGCKYVDIDYCGSSWIYREGKVVEEVEYF